MANAISHGPSLLKIRRYMGEARAGGVAHTPLPRGAVAVRVPCMCMYVYIYICMYVK